MRIAVIVGSTRPGRVGPEVAAWVAQQAEGRTATYDIVDLADFNLPIYDEPKPAASGEYLHAHTRRWAETIAAYDGFVFVTPEYNHSIPASLKNALDFIYGEWVNKSAGIVSYGSVGGVRAAEQLRLILSELQIAHVRNQVTLNLSSEFTAGAFTPSERQGRVVNRLFAQVEAWAGALATLRA